MVTLIMIAIGVTAILIYHACCVAKVERLQVELNQARCWSQAWKKMAKMCHKLYKTYFKDYRFFFRAWLDGAAKHESIVESLRAELEQVAAWETAFRQAVDWLYGFWDGNTLIAAQGADVEALHEAWDDLLAVSMEPSQAAAALLERLKFLEKDSDHQRSGASQVLYYKDKFATCEQERDELRLELEQVELQLTHVIVQRERARIARDYKEGELTYLRPALLACQAERDAAKQDLEALE